MYYICYPGEENDIYETVSGEDAMHQRVSELLDAYDMDPEDIHVFHEKDEIR